jgi:hypothetical protein
MIERIKKFGLEYFGIYYSDYEGTITKNNDPEGRGRVQFKCPAVFGDHEPEIWALPKGMFSGKQIGFYGIPQEGDPVWISFRSGKVRFPMWQYGFIPKGFGINGVSEKIWKLRTVKGFQIELNEKDGEIYTITSPKGKTFILDDKNGQISLKHEKNSELTFDDHISMKAGGESMFNLVNTFIDIVSNAVITTPSGPGAIAPPTKTQLTQLKTKFSKLLK